jgi:uncharacterized protein YdcH (DUF465 family)
MDTATDTRARLARTDANFRRLEAKHGEYEARLEELGGRKFLTEEEKVEEVRLKKLKLAVKDQMEQILRRAGE